MFGIRHIKLSFFIDFLFKEKSFPGFYNKVFSKISDGVLLNNETVFKKNTSKKVYSISDIPDYFSLETSEELSKLRTLRAPLYNGFYIDLGKYCDLNDYMNNKLGRARKSQLKRYRKRLDLCLTPIYKVYFGGIQKNEYDYIFDSLKNITIRRFEQKEETNFELSYLDKYHEMMFPLIHQKKACIFVIYDKQKPVNISLNFIEGQLLLHWNSCFDIDYYMFNLGHINMVNHLQWCFDHGIKIFDMGRGDFLHKRKYITDSYIYQEHITYHSKSTVITLFAHYRVLVLKLRFTLIKILKKINAQVLYSRYAKVKYQIRNYKNTKKTQKDIVVETVISNLPDSIHLKAVDIDEIAPALIQPLNDFLYNHKEPVNNIKVYQDNSYDKTLYLVGKRKMIKLDLSI
ncbi:GNAT family N-acetyltransferase [Tamlana sp. 2201CG12-4]|uniref:GNAT family N-acetyltransferase n=1 Tax=Tamlana sp. 2201CG12-4 TaxID=3112582 RepID=UPI002DBC5F40|nr:GNAT family N-acetyltransferase [Tamlana sp. 2201CG12-4]MEC3908028.1 GNAT family N-acetyltransferase [Tamlana sp. 2201CG12-4]